MLLGTADLWQLLKIETNPYLLAIQQDALPSAIREYAHVEPEIRLGYYRNLEAGELNQTIFQRLSFYETVDHTIPLQMPASSHSERDRAF
jgi:hypothetical protein